MKLNTKMPALLKSSYTIEIGHYKQAVKKQTVEKAWHHLERAHIIGQRYPFQHTETHWKMLLLGFRTTNIKEILGQTIRLLLGAPFSLINKIPVGNIGSTKVSMIKSQEMPEDILKLFNQSE
ncbi:MAG: DUF3703 domain-containing protein [Reichenbachiella sp.]|uniref:DUF3703 domain-containing protein n=1 Tax=Reichenbachiella sp. TaxID=2184521 RepID=UPI003299D800